MITFGVFLSLGISIAGCLHQEEENYFEYYFEISLKNDTISYFLIPVPVDSRDGYNEEMEVSEIVNDLDIISGNGSYIYEEAFYGKALNITFNNSILIVGKAWFYDSDHVNQERYFFDELSMKSFFMGNKYYYFYSSDPSNILIHYECSLKHIGSLDDSKDFYKELSYIEFHEGWKGCTMQNK